MKGHLAPINHTHAVTLPLIDLRAQHSTRNHDGQGLPAQCIQDMQPVMREADPRTERLCPSVKQDILE